MKVDDLDLNLYLDLVKSESDKSKQERLIKYLERYLETINVNKKLTLRDAENKVYSVGGVPLTNREKINKLLILYSSRILSDKEQEEYDNLVSEVNELLDYECSSSTKIEKIRKLLAKYGIEHNINSYLFEENAQLFREKYMEVFAVRKSVR